VQVGRAIAVIQAHSLRVEWRRKVRAPQDGMPGNAWEARAYGKCHRKQTGFRGWRWGKGEKVR